MGHPSTTFQSSVPGSRSPVGGAENACERAVSAYFTAIPLLWVSGLLLPLALLLVFFLFMRTCSRRGLVLAWPWFLVGSCQLASVVSNLLAEGQPVWMVARHLLASYVMGWFTLGGAISIGASGVVRSEVLWRSAARIGTYAVVLSFVLYPIALVYPERYLHILTPIGLLLPVSFPSTSFFFGMLLFNWEELFGVSLPRLSLFFPWTTALGFGGLCLIFVALNDTHPRRRRRAIASGVFMVLSSMSRLSFSALLAAALTWWFLRRTRRTQVMLLTSGVTVAAAILIGSTLWFGSPTGLAAAVSDRFEDVRPSASRSRELVYEESWAGFQRAPLLGHGWPGEAVYPEDWPQVMQGGGTMVPGSHSTLLGLLYLGGLVTLGAFLFALLRTIVASSFWAMEGRPPCRPFEPTFERGAMDRTEPVPPLSVETRIRHSTAALLVGIAVTAVGESLFSVVVPSLFAFLWLGAALRSCTEPVPRRATVSVQDETMAWGGAVA